MVQFVLNWFCSEKKTAIKNAKWLLKFVKGEIAVIRMCSECFEYLNENQFELICRDPYLIVWAKQQKHPFWPAKLISVNSETKSTSLIYFGDKHYLASIPTKNCFMHSKLLGQPKQNQMPSDAHSVCNMFSPLLPIMWINQN